MKWHNSVMEDDRERKCVGDRALCIL